MKDEKESEKEAQIERKMEDRGKGYLGIYKKIWSVFLKKHFPNAYIKNIVFQNIVKTPIFYLKNIEECF